MVFADDIRKIILQLADQHGPGNAFYPAEVAQRIDPVDWVKQMEQVKLVAEALISEGQIIATKSGTGIETAYAKPSLFAEHHE